MHRMRLKTLFRLQPIQDIAMPVLLCIMRLRVLLSLFLCSWKLSRMIIYRPFSRASASNSAYFFIKKFQNSARAFLFISKRFLFYKYSIKTRVISTLWPKYIFNPFCILTHFVGSSSARIR